MLTVMTLVVERKDQSDRTVEIGQMMLTPSIDEGYWAYRVVLSPSQALNAFPKFGTVGIGFAVEEDWNTNLPYTCGVDEIWEHIRHNKGDDSISDTDCIQAIVMLRNAINEDRAR